MSEKKYINDVDFPSVMDDEYSCAVVGNPMGNHFQLVDTEIISYLGESLAVDEKEYVETDTPSNFCIHWKHSETDTHMKLMKKYQYDSLRYHACVTIRGTAITVGEYKWSRSFDVVMNWAIRWMGRHYDDVSWLHD